MHTFKVAIAERTERPWANLSRGFSLFNTLLGGFSSLAKDSRSIFHLFFWSNNVCKAIFDLLFKDLSAPLLQLPGAR
jgi:hypothetical protein